MVIQEVSYNFEEFPKYADDFIRDLLRLMIISKMNSPLKKIAAKNYFLHLVDQIEGCGAHVVKYGQPLLYAIYHGIEFTDQKVTSQFVRINDHVIDVTMKSVFADFIKTFDNLASMSQSKVKWGIEKTQVASGIEPTSQTSINTNSEFKADPLYAMLDSFVDSVNRLTLLDPTSSQDSLMSKKFGVKNAIITRKSMHLEILINGELNILELNPTKRKNRGIELIFGKSQAAKAIVVLMSNR